MATVRRADPCYVDELIKGLTSMMATPEDISGPINLGNPEEITILELAEKIIAMTNSSSGIIFQPLPQDDPIQRQPDITLAGKILNWQPETSLEEGLTRTIDYFRKKLNRKRNF
jgi:UDP-glucuronate decarboxylase